MHQLLNESVDVDVTFRGKRIHPNRIRWGQRIYDMPDVNLVHQAHEGRKRIFYFSISDKTNFMKLRFDPELLEWKLVEFYTD